ncbi:MAG: hypothetical protein ACKOTD_05205 [Phycisphaerales bacterium]
MLSRIRSRHSSSPPAPADARLLGLRGAMDALAVASLALLA